MKQHDTHKFYNFYTFVTSMRTMKMSNEKITLNLNPNTKHKNQNKTTRG